MRIIITGGTGLIGRALATNLARDAHEVIVLSRSPERAATQPGVQMERWEARTAEGWGHLAEGAHAIVNLAGENPAGKGFLPSRWTPERRRAIRESRVNAGRAVLQAVDAAAHKPGVVVQASGSGYYGPHGHEEVTEETPPGDDFLARIARDDWEPSTAPVEAMGVRRAIIRSGIVLSREGGALPRLLLPFRFFLGGPLGGGRQGIPWIHIADEVAAMRFAIESDSVSGPLNAVAPHPLTNAEFIRVLGRVMGRPAFVPIPAFGLRLLFGDVASLLLQGQLAVPQRLLDLGFAFRFPEAEAALRDLLA
jgi:uncharacterized protein (TIGR01777 family)